MNRRKFLVGGAGVGAIGLLSGTVAVGWDDLLHAAHERPLTDNVGILVIVTLYGGNDGINTVIPYADNAYHDARPELAYTPEHVLRLDAQLGLNPALSGLAQLWEQRQLAIVRGVGYPKPDHSHFRSMDIWQTASPAEPVPTGWIGRWLDATGDDPLRAVNIGSVLPLVGVGEKHTAAALSTTTVPAGRAGRTDMFRPTIQALGVDDPTDTPAMAAVRQSYRAARTTEAAFAPITAQQDENNALASRLSMVAAAILARVPTRVYLVHLGGFDTHANERGTQQRLLRTFDEAISGFLQKMAPDPCGRNVVVLAYSEFGRRVAANASQGTDHGTAGPAFLAGASVKGGFYGEDPSLIDLDHGDLKYTTDFRDVYHDLLVHTLTTDPTPSVGTGRSGIGFL
ncbi:hypothetical protein A5645_21705 [Mycobacterium asiaticum]|uniref:DUF1501 domain-containing protein n=1 Tax=Mycobacterium asiaticum TaxID=1790 RepID=UPI0007EF1353|nr:DUF1501 domain-containing protein [Mycobacterium asiaticum]OBK93525.1 hypothetical protein A5645_21705 [Mycobacterium asiaticum]